MKHVLLIVGFLYLSGCAPKTISKIEPCGLITKEEAASALGGNVEVTPTPNVKACAYSLVGSANATRYGSIIVRVVTSDSPQFQKFGSTDDRNATKPIAGIGDRAVLLMSRERPDEGAKAMQVLKGNVYISIGMSTSSSPVSEDVLKSLAAKAVGRLP
jgi:hypothetical protein